MEKLNFEQMECVKAGINLSGCITSGAALGIGWYGLIGAAAAASVVGIGLAVGAMLISGTFNAYTCWVE